MTVNLMVYQEDLNLTPDSADLQSVLTKTEDQKSKSLFLYLNHT